MIRLLMVLSCAVVMSSGFLSEAKAQSTDEDNSYLNSKDDEQLLALLEQYVSTDARSWSFNRYIAGSMHDIEVTRRGGRIVRMQASYFYDGFMSGMSGWVEMDIAWTENTGRYCITYHDYPNTCRPIRRPY